MENGVLLVLILVILVYLFDTGPDEYNSNGHIPNKVTVFVDQHEEDVYRLEREYGRLIIQLYHEKKDEG